MPMPKKIMDRSIPLRREKKKLKKKKEKKIHFNGFTPMPMPILIPILIPMPTPKIIMDRSIPLRRESIKTIFFSKI